MTVKYADVMTSTSGEAASTDEANNDHPETTHQLRQSFFYGSRSDLNFKFLKDLDDREFGTFLSELLGAVSELSDSGDPDPVIDVAYRWQIEAYRGHLGDPDDFPHRYADTPFARLDKPLADSRVGLITSSGHFVDGDDPRPFGEENMSQAEAEARIGEFLKVAPELSSIPMDTPGQNLVVRHGGYPVQAVAADHQVALPLGHLRTLAEEGVIGETAPSAYSFVGAASQVRLKKQVAAEWAQRMHDEEIDVVLLVPV